MLGMRFVRFGATAFLTGGLFSGVPGASAAQTQTAASGSTYVVVYNQSAVPADAAGSIARAGGSLVQSYDAIGVAIASSSSAQFRQEVRKDTRVDEAAPTANFGVRLKDRLNEGQDGVAASSLASTPATDSDSLSGLQWDMRQIKAPEAHRITGGSRSVLVGDIDTGLDYKHPDLKGNVDFAASASCITGKPDTSPAAWNDDNGHGTHTAGTIAAASNGLGIVGVAPNVRIAAIKAGDINGFFFPQAVVCAFMWAATHNVDITNNSYFADPFYFNCPRDPVQRAILTAETRAIRFAQNRGVLVVAATGNFSDNLANPTLDRQSPDDAIPVERRVDRSCMVVPTDLPGVVGVGATGDLSLKSFYSNYGQGITELVAPGGDSILQVTPDALNGRVLSTWPPALITANDCLKTRKIVIATSDPDEPNAVYCYLQGTSMASPHVVGVAALIQSRFGNQLGAFSARAALLRTALDRATDPIACPDKTTLESYAPFPSVNNDAPQECIGGRNYNSWYGHGETNALKAVSGFSPFD